VYRLFGWSSRRLAATPFFFDRLRGLAGVGGAVSKVRAWGGGVTGSGARSPTPSSLPSPSPSSLVRCCFSWSVYHAGNARCGPRKPRGSPLLADASSWKRTLFSGAVGGAGHTAVVITFTHAPPFNRSVSFASDTSSSISLIVGSPSTIGHWQPGSTNACAINWLPPISYFTSTSPGHMDSCPPAPLTLTMVGCIRCLKLRATSGCSPCSSSNPTRFRSLPVSIMMVMVLPSTSPSQNICFLCPRPYCIMPLATSDWAALWLACRSIRRGAELA